MGKGGLSVAEARYPRGPRVKAALLLGLRLTRLMVLPSVLVLLFCLGKEWQRPRADDRDGKEKRSGERGNEGVKLKHGVRENDLEKK